MLVCNLSIVSLYRLSSIVMLNAKNSNIQVKVFVCIEKDTQEQTKRNFEEIERKPESAQ